MSARHGQTLNIRRSASPLERLVEEKERCEALNHSPWCPSSTFEWKDTYTVLKAAVNDRHKTSPLAR
ncbi:hypothetical protein TNCV_3584721 [Trichonephila clavipes]|nr:hypothetical protein TNCV_3584721 [Trichonephila clavipes]